MTRFKRFAVVASLFAVFQSVQMLAQDETIPDAVARGASGRHRSRPSGPIPTVRQVLDVADLVVRGRIEDSVSYLSEDKKDVYTDHLLDNPTIIFQSDVSSSAQPGAPTPIKVTQLGGSVTVGGKRYTQIEEGLPQLTKGTEGLFVATKKGGKYHIAEVFYGAFQINRGLLKPLAGRPDFATDLQDVPIATGMALIQGKLQEARGVAR